MTHPPHPLLRRSVGATKCAIVGVLAFLAVSTGSSTAALDTSSEVSVSEALLAPPAGEARLVRLLARHDCSATGFGADVIPGSSLVLQDEQVHHVSFDEGWDVYTGAEPGTLLAVCRASV